MCKSQYLTWRFAVLAVGLGLVQVEGLSAGAAELTDAPRHGGYAFFAFDNGTGRGEVPVAGQVAMLKELGYDGIGFTGAANIPEMLAALDGQGLKMYSIYVASHVGPNGPSFDPNLKQGLRDLKGRDTIVWLTVQGSAPDGDRQAVQVVREVADLAAENGLRVALYPHVGFHVASIADGLRIVQQADRPNLGVSLNLCHRLKLDGDRDLEAVIRRALPHLMLVSINGADQGDTQAMGWDRLIQTLDRGTYDVSRFVQTLHDLGYRGAIGLQCYKIQGDRRENLQRSIRAWRKLTGNAREPASDS